MTLEVLYLDGCPSHERLLPVLHDLAAAHGLELTERRIDTAAHAEQVRFLGSPSVRVNGIDVEPGAQNRTDFGLKCRLYRSPDGHTGLPPQQWIHRALQEAGAMTTLGCCSVDELPERLNDRQRIVRTTVGGASLGLAVLAGRRAGVLGALAAAGAGWFGVSHLVAARTGYAGCPELGAIPSVLLRREVHVGCVPWQIADRRLGLTM